MKGRVLASGLITLIVMAAMAAGPVVADTDRDKDESYGYGYQSGWGYGDNSPAETGWPESPGYGD